MGKSFFLPVCMRSTYMTGACGIRKGFGFLELDLQMVVNHCMGAGNGS